MIKLILVLVFSVNIFSTSLGGETEITFLSYDGFSSENTKHLYDKCEKYDQITHRIGCYKDDEACCWGGHQILLERTEKSWMVNLFPVQPNGHKDVVRGMGIGFCRSKDLSFRDCDLIFVCIYNLEDGKFRGVRRAELIRGTPAAGHRFYSLHESIPEAILNITGLNFNDHLLCEFELGDKYLSRLSKDKIYYVQWFHNIINATDAYVSPGIHASSPKSIRDYISFEAVPPDIRAEREDKARTGANQKSSLSSAITPKDNQTISSSATSAIKANLGAMFFVIAIVFF